ncbi:MAG: hypothetical protein SGPRY_006731 [Prymnesium sp.]
MAPPSLQRYYMEAEALVKSWKLADYQYFIAVADRPPTSHEEGVDFKITFSRPTKELPIPEHTASINMTVFSFPDGETPDEDAMNDYRPPRFKFLYQLEHQHQEIDGGTKIK